MKTYSATPSDITQAWWVVDAQDVVVGRLASKIAMILRGKHKPMFTPHMDCGDFVVVVNADKAKFTGSKRQAKRYYRHTGHPGGIKETSPEKIFASAHPERVIEQAVLRMLPKESPLARQQYGKLRVYAGAEHPHTAQQPQVLDFASQNPKNKRSNKR
jgi:large subunit ribosomal protein L13